MSQNIQNENIFDKEKNKETNEEDYLNTLNKLQRRKGTNYGIMKIKNNQQKSNEVQEESPKQLESNSGYTETQVFPGNYRFINNSQINGADKLNENNINSNNIINSSQDNKNDDTNNEKQYGNESQNNEFDKFKENSYFDNNMRNPYQDIKNDESNNEKENNDYQNSEKEIFYSQCSINEQNIENNNNELSINPSSNILKDNNEDFHDNNNNNSRLNEIKNNASNENNEIRVRRYNLPLSINGSVLQTLVGNPYSENSSVFNQEEKNNSINNQANKDDNSNIINNSSNNNQQKEGPNIISISPLNSETEDKFGYSQPNLNYNFPSNNSKINKDSNIFSKPNNDNNKNNNENINHNEKNDINIDNKIISDNSNKQKVPKHVLDRYKKVSKTGLMNLDDTSYINAVLQSLGQVRHFASYFLNPKNQAIIESKLTTMPLAFVTQRLFTHLYPYPEINIIEIYSPESYLEILSFLKSPFGKKRNNPNDLLIYILNTLHSELNSNKNNNNINKMPYNYYFSADNVIQNGISNFTNNNKSKISDVVCWFQLIELKCTYCGISTFSFNSFNTYDLDIKNTYAYCLHNGKNYINIYDCLSYGAMPKECRSYCNNCKSRAINYKQSRIYSPPNVFIFLLDRGIDFNQNYNHIPFIVDEKIDLSNFIIRQNTPRQYRLTGIVSFNLKEQKYVSYCESPIDSNWYLYNDEKVNLVFCKDILNNKNGNDIPCILYYKPI